MKFDHVDDVVWLQTSFLGDIVLATGAMALLKERFPHVRQHLVTTKIGEAVLRGSPLLNSIVVFDKKERALGESFRQVRRGLLNSLDNPRRAVLLQAHTSMRSSLLAMFLRFSGLRRVTYDETTAAWGATLVPRIATFHEVSRVAMLLQPFGIARADILAARPQLSPLPLSGRLQALLSEGSPLIGIAPGSVWATKRWTPEGFQKLTDMLLREHPQAKLVMLGSPAEKAAADTIAAQTTSTTNIVNLAGETSLTELAAVIARLHLIVCNDSAPIHFASAFDIPTVAIFGATVPSLGFGPLARHSEVVENPTLTCRPCSSHGPMVCPLTHFRCMRDVRAEDVFAACQRLLRA